MKKILALVLCSMMLMLAAAAMADAVKLGDTDFSVTLPAGMEEAELESADTEEGMVAVYLNEDESLEMDVYVADAEGTLADIEAECKADEAGAQVGYTTINGVEVLYVTGTEDGTNYIDYMIIDGQTELVISFMITNETAGQLSAEIMNTLTK